MFSSTHFSRPIIMSPNHAHHHRTPQVFANVNQLCCIPICDEAVSDPRQLPRVCVFAALLLLVIYMGVALAVSTQYGLGTFPDFLTNYATNDPLMVLCRFLLVFVLYLAIVLNV